MASNRVRQWAVLTRTWWLYDAKFQCPYRSAEKICMYLEGRHKPLFHPLSDVGDHVVVINTKHIAMVEDLWRKQQYKHDTRYAGGKSSATAWRLHELDPTWILEKAVYRAGPKNLLRHKLMKRLHLFPEKEVPEDILENVTDVIRQIQVVPKTLEDYTEEQHSKFPKVFDWPEDYKLVKPDLQTHSKKITKDTSKKK